MATVRKAAVSVVVTARVRKVIVLVATGRKAPEHPTREANAANVPFGDRAARPQGDRADRPRADFKPRTDFKPRDDRRPAGDRPHWKKDGDRPSGAPSSGERRFGGQSDGPRRPPHHAGPAP